MSVLTANGATRHIAFPVVGRRLRSQNKVPFSVSAPSKPSNGTPRRAACAIVADVDDKTKTHEEERLHSKDLRKGECAVAFRGIVNVFVENINYYVSYF